MKVLMVKQGGIPHKAEFVVSGNPSIEIVM